MGSFTGSIKAVRAHVSYAMGCVNSEPEATLKSYDPGNLDDLKDDIEEEVRLGDIPLSEAPKRLQGAIEDSLLSAIVYEVLAEIKAHGYTWFYEDNDIMFEKIGVTNA